MENKMKSSKALVLALLQEKLEECKTTVQDAQNKQLAQDFIEPLLSLQAELESAIKKAKKLPITW
jgi:hypothetical protein